MIGVREEEDGSKTYKVTYGSGFDADIAVVKGNKLKLPVVPAAEADAELSVDVQGHGHPCPCAFN